ncbi:MAG: hypothetical protein IKA64_07575 [Clostridia bacterium]|nr:hypothetical protein [Clostridia bacterium]
MTAKEINEKALLCLERQNWREAQRLLFFNAKRSPSHQTYNNLGYYLITEGLECSNGKVRNALKLGVKYLKKAAELGTTVLNINALVEAVEYELRSADEKESGALYEYARSLTQKALSIEYSNELQYNFLRYSYLLNPCDGAILSQARALIKSFVCDSSVSLYLGLLLENGLSDEGLECIEKFSGLLDKADLLMLYTRLGLYNNGYELCKSVFEEYAIDKFLASAIMECSIATKHFEEAGRYAKQMIEQEQEINRSKKGEKHRDFIFHNSKEAADSRKSLIRSYKIIPPAINTCCYFGCPMHNTKW